MAGASEILGTEEPAARDARCSRPFPATRHGPLATCVDRDDNIDQSKRRKGPGGSSRTRNPTGNCENAKGRENAKGKGDDKHSYDARFRAFASFRVFAVPSGRCPLRSAGTV